MLLIAKKKSTIKGIATMSKEKEYIVSFTVEKVYSFKAKSKLDIEELFDYYAEKGVEELEKKVKDGIATEDPDDNEMWVKDESLTISEIDSPEWRQY